VLHCTVPDIACQRKPRSPLACARTLNDDGAQASLRRRCRCEGKRGISVQVASLRCVPRLPARNTEAIAVGDTYDAAAGLRLIASSSVVC